MRGICTLSLIFFFFVCLAKRVKGPLQRAGNEGPDQPAHSRRLIRAFVTRLQNQWLLWNVSWKSPDQTAIYRLVTTFAFVNGAILSHEIM